MITTDVPVWYDELPKITDRDEHVKNFESG